MSKFILTFIDEDTSVTTNFKATHIDEVTDRFDSFLRGCGYVPDGEFGIVKPSETMDDNFFFVSADCNHANLTSFADDFLID